MEKELAESMPGVLELAGIVHDSADGGTAEEYCSWTMANRAAEAVAARLSTAKPRAAICQTGWLPIETAPKVYRQEIIVYRPNAKREPTIGIDYWSDRYSVEPCWAKSGTPQAHSDEQPSHWMPLPEAPRRALKSTNQQVIRSQGDN